VKAIPIPIDTEFTYLTVLCKGPVKILNSLKRGKPRRVATSICLCRCGQIVTVENQNLRSGNSESCGCLSIQKTVERSTKHGLASRTNRTNTYLAWVAMKQRCKNPNGDHFDRYGGRGITVCAGWDNSYESFFSDLGHCPPGMEIDRWPDNDGHYSCGHCEDCRTRGLAFNARWATIKQQQRNKSTNRIITVRGITACFAELCERFQVHYGRTYARIFDYGWSIERAFFEPPRRSRWTSK
jgi:hypothetical protein